MTDETGSSRDEEADQSRRRARASPAYDRQRRSSLQSKIETHIVTDRL